MKISFTTLGCPDWSFDKILKEANRLGFDGVEVRGIDGIMRAEEIPLFFPENALSTEQYIKEHNLELMGFGTSASFHTEESAEKGIDEGKKAIDVCSRVGIPSIRVFGDAIPDPYKFDETVTLVKESIAKLCEYAEGKNVNVLLEIHGGFNTVETIKPVIEHCKKYASFGILWDIEHSDRAYADDWRPFYELIRPYIKNTHIKDHIRNNDGTYTLCLVGEGDIPVADIIKTLEKDGYNGYYSLEWEKKWVPELPDPEVALPAFMNFLKSI